MPDKDEVEEGRDCSSLEKQLEEMKHRIRLRQLEDDIAASTAELQNYQQIVARYNSGIQGLWSVPARSVERMFITPVGANIQRMKQEIQSNNQIIAANQGQIATSQKEIIRLEKEMLALEAGVSSAIDDAGSIAGEEFDITGTPGDLERMRKRIEDELLLCYSETGKHVNGQAHDSTLEYSGGFMCWCGEDHGRHNLLGGATCWCGKYEEGIGHPR